MRLGRAYIYGRHHDRGIEQCHKAMELDPNLAPAHWCIGLAYVGKELYRQAIAECRKWGALGKGPEALGALGYAYGDTKQAKYSPTHNAITADLPLALGNGRSVCGARWTPLLLPVTDGCHALPPFAVVACLSRGWDLL
jgi:hypothetical protein